MNSKKNIKPFYLFLGIVAILALLAVVWYLISPLFINVTVDEEFPTANNISSDEVVFPVAEATEAMEKAMEEPDVPMEEPMPAEEMGSMQILSQGNFYPIAHEGEGLATIYQLKEGDRILRLEDFMVLNGPELHVWLVGSDPVKDSVGIDPEVYFDLGLLKGNIGDQNYEIPDDLDLSVYKSVAVWCVPFKVPFSGAALISP